MASFTQLIKSVTPPQVILTDAYDGLEYRWKFLTFRPALFSLEPYLIGVVAFYFLFFLYGKSVNRSKTNAWYKAHLDIFNAQFATTTPDLIADGNTDFYGFSTGRRTIASLHTVFALVPRHDFAQWMFQTLRSLVDLDYKSTDIVELDFKLADSSDLTGFVWGVVRKDIMRQLPNERWDLTFTKTSENQALPVNFSVMSEFADITEAMFRSSGTFSLPTLLKDTKFHPYLRSLTVTDQPRKRPFTGPVPVEKRAKHVILTLDLPSGSNTKDTRELVAGVFQFIDALTKASLRPETRTKLRKAREDVDKQLTIDASREANEEREQAVDDKKAAKRKLEDERIAKLPAAEQQKIIERERKRSARKAQAKIARR